MLFDVPDTSRFLAALERLKRERQKREQQTRQARKRVRQLLKKSSPRANHTPAN